MKTTIRTLKYSAICPWCASRKPIGSPQALGGHVKEYHLGELERLTPLAKAAEPKDIALFLFISGYVELILKE